MKPLFRRFSFLFLLSLPAISALAQSGFPPVALGLKPNRQEYWVGEPIVVQCRVVNWYDPLLNLRFVPGILALDGGVHIKGGDWEIDRYLGHLEEGTPPPRNLLLGYGQGYEFDFSILFQKDSSNHLALPFPGRFDITLEQSMELKKNYISPLSTPEFGTLAQSVEVTVVEPPEAMKPALEKLASHPTLTYDVSRQLASYINAPLLLEIANDYPDSRYAPHCLHAVVNLYSIMGQERYEDLVTCMELAQRLIENYPDYPYRDDLRVGLAEMIYLDGRLNEAVKMIDRLVEEDEDNLVRYRKSVLVKPRLGADKNPYASMTYDLWYLFDSLSLPSGVITNLSISVSD